MDVASLRTSVSLAALCLVGGCAAMPRTVPAFTTSASPPVPPHGIILVVDGAGGQPDATRVVAKAVKDAGTPLLVRSFNWTHGAGLGVSDMTDVEYARAQGRCLAAHIVANRASAPDVPIYLIGYSAGAHVALEATRWIESNSVERTLLLAPAVAADYDLRPALIASRQGVDAFTSQRDRFFLGLGPRLVGTADGKFFVPPAGRVGFDPPPLSPADAALAQRLRQHPWDSSVAWSGNAGSHAGTLNAAYFRAYVLPLLTAQ